MILIRSARGSERMIRFVFIECDKNKEKVIVIIRIGPNHFIKN